MTDKEKLIAWLKNLKLQGKSNASVNIDLLLGCLEHSNPREIPPKEPTILRVDGGGFK